MNNLINNHFLFVLNSLSVLAMAGMFGVLYVFHHEGQEPAFQLGAILTSIATLLVFKVRKSLNSEYA